jgi:hypothetical protein
MITIPIESNSIEQVFGIGYWSMGIERFEDIEDIKVC